MRRFLSMYFADKLDSVTNGSFRHLQKRRDISTPILNGSNCGIWPIVLNCPGDLLRPSVRNRHIEAKFDVPASQIGGDFWPNVFVEDVNNEANLHRGWSRAQLNRLQCLGRGIEEGITVPSAGLEIGALCPFIPGI